MVLFRQDCRSMGCVAVKWVAASQGRWYTGRKQLNSARMRELVTEENTPLYDSDQPFYCFWHSSVKILWGQTTANAVVLFFISAASSNENSDSLISQYYVNVQKITVVNVWRGLSAVKVFIMFDKVMAFFCKQVKIKHVSPQFSIHLCFGFPLKFKFNWISFV